jgi:hypothetical protein
MGEQGMGFIRRGIILKEPNSMSGVFRNIEPLPPHRPASVYPPAFGAGGGHTRGVERGWGGGRSIVWKTPDTVLHSTVLYICKYSTLWILCTGDPHYVPYTLLLIS